MTLLHIYPYEIACRNSHACTVVMQKEQFPQSHHLFASIITPHTSGQPPSFSQNLQPLALWGAEPRLLSPPLDCLLNKPFPLQTPASQHLACYATIWPVNQVLGDAFNLNSCKWEKLWCQVKAVSPRRCQCVQWEAERDSPVLLIQSFSARRQGLGSSIFGSQQKHWPGPSWNPFNNFLLLIIPVPDVRSLLIMQKTQIWSWRNL